MAPQRVFVGAASALLMAVAACSSASSSSSPPASSVSPDASDAAQGCSVLFGIPNEKTGLGADKCAPSCSCGNKLFSRPAYDAPFIQKLVTDFRLATPYAEVTNDPYAGAVPEPDAPGTVCGVRERRDAAASPRVYDLVTYSSETDAKLNGAIPTHFGRCGTCSTLENLAVYMRENDLTAPVRACGIANEGPAVVACLQKLGFDLPCAQIWAFNVAHTREKCLDVCLANFSKPYNLEDGSLNPCIRCDEDKSGPVFKAVAGRTRRNSGLPNAICRPCDEVEPLQHVY